MYTKIAQCPTTALLRVEHPGHVPITIAPRRPVDDAEVHVRDAAHIAEGPGRPGNTVDQRNRHEPLALLRHVDKRAHIVMRQAYRLIRQDRNIVLKQYGEL